MNERGRRITLTLLAIVGLASACTSAPSSGSDGGTTTAPADGGTSDAGPSDGGPSDGGTSDAGPSDGGMDGGGSACPESPGGPLQLKSVATFGTPFDAVPDTCGTTLYFTASDSTARVGVFSVSADGSGQTPTSISVSDQFALPVAIVLSSDGKTLYVADAAASVDGAADDSGAIFAVPVEGGAATPVMGTGGFAPLGLAIRATKSGDELVFTGTSPVDGRPGLYSVAAAGGQVSTIAAGAPFVDPESVLVLPSGDLVVVDMLSETALGASVLMVKGGVATSLATGVDSGWPGGLALDQTSSRVLVSSLVAGAGPSLVSIDPSTGTRSTTTFDAPAPLVDPGGLHRALGADVFAWVDGSDTAGAGHLYVLAHSQP